MPRPPRVTSVQPLGALRVRVVFDDDLVRELDLSDCALGGPLEALNDPLLFAQVRVDPVARTICWPNGIDLDPDVLHGDAEPATGAAPRVLSEHHLRPAG